MKTSEVHSGQKKSYIIRNDNLDNLIKLGYKSIFLSVVLGKIEIDFDQFYNKLTIEQKMWLENNLDWIISLKNRQTSWDY